ncbi:FMN-dependent NADH-azoreductase [Maricaulis maris]|uniref:FMN dependent NADH:quinone oxidoreductase n=1 Tax=Maricaulis maris TaxID=74318 RepID=A0A495DL47_9PROT|nr:NAD(P)H-dependent oxidoreductase [Maricaulis maris]RKR03635.1 FMN-dependent NADH-azoreductase [Maricaulis maris]
MTNPATRHILRVDASMRHDGSVTRQLTETLVDRLSSGDTAVRITRRDLADNPPAYIDEAWIGANFTDADARSDAQKAVLARSDALVAELQAADTLVIATPVYNFGIPAALKAWIDLIARARVTFKYTETGPVGLLTGKRAILVVASGGTRVGSEIDFATNYMKHVLGFIGIHDVEIIAADQLGQGADEKLAAAGEAIERLAA